MGNAFNLLTEELLLSGYSKEEYPEYVKMPYGSGEESLDNIYGGFEFQRNYLEQHFFQTGCGLCVTARNCISGMGYMGINWCFENDNVLIKCPYHKEGCERNHPVLADMKPAFCFCACHMTDHYDYENSVEKLLREQDEEKERLYKQYEKEHSGRICRNHMYYKEEDKEWVFRYDPVKCVGRCSYGFCPVRSRMLVKEKGNVFYDICISTVRKDGTFFDGQPIISIVKGRKFLERQVSMDICRAIAACGKDEIFRREWWNGYSMQKLYDPNLEIEILNIRAERRAFRDLEQDLEDIRNGISVVHESDRIKAQKERKKVNKQKRLERLERKIAKSGYGALTDAEQRMADKKIGADKVAILEQERQCTGQNRQLSLSMWMEL